MSNAQLVMGCLDQLARISEEPSRLTRTYGSTAMRQANELVAGWMRAAGMSTRTDAIGNLVGHYPAAKTGAKTFLLGSHLDTVRDAGKFDGSLGVLTAIACVKQLHRAGVRLPFAIEVIAFADEEGVRFQSTYLGSRALAGTLRAEDLRRTDARGISLAEAIRQSGGNPKALGNAERAPARLLGYTEVHIEQGPVLEQQGLPVGVVTAIAGQSRLRVGFVGAAGHAGTVPMHLRRDALVGAAEFVASVPSVASNHRGLVATVGQIQAAPGASNVIPGLAVLTLDVRHERDDRRRAAAHSLRARAATIARRRGLKLQWSSVQESASVRCDPKLTQLLTRCTARRGLDVLKLPSGAGHDAAALAAVCPVAMLFVRCKGGISHHPAESVKTADVRVAIAVMNNFLKELAGIG